MQKKHAHSKPELLTVPEAAAVLKVSRRFLELEVTRRRIAVVHLSARLVRIKREDLDAYVERYRLAAAAEGLKYGKKHRS